VLRHKTRLTACLLHYDPASYASGALGLSRSAAEPERKRVLNGGRATLKKVRFPGVDPKPGRSTHEQGEAWVTPSGGPHRCGLKTARMTCG
jgi:hypothetical protein